MFLTCFILLHLLMFNKILKKHAFRPSEKIARMLSSSAHRFSVSNVSERNSSRFCTGDPRTAVPVRSVVRACSVSTARAHHSSQHNMSQFSELLDLLE